MDYLYLIKGRGSQEGSGAYVWGRNEKDARLSFIRTNITFSIGSIEKIEYEVLVECEGDKTNYEEVIDDVIVGDEIIEYMDPKLFASRKETINPFLLPW